MSEMVERVARAMGDAADAYAAGEGFDPEVFDADLLLELAAVAIEAHKAALAEAGFVIVPREVMPAPSSAAPGALR